MSPKPASRVMNARFSRRRRLGLAKGVAEYKGRRDKQPREVPLDRIAGFLHENIKNR